MCVCLFVRKGESEDCAPEVEGYCIVSAPSPPALSSDAHVFCRLNDQQEKKRHSSV